MALLRSQGLRHMQREPSGFWGYVKDDTHSIGSVTGAIMAWSTTSCRSFSIASQHSMGTFLLTCCTGGTEGSRQMVYTPGILHLVSIEWGNAFLFKEIMSCTSFTEAWSWNVLFSMGFGMGKWSLRGVLWSCNDREWSCNDCTCGWWWSWRVLLTMVLCFKVDFSFSGFSGVLSAGVL